SEPQSGGEPPRDGRERSALAQELRPDQVKPDVAVAEPEPRLPAEVGNRAERVPALVGPAPAPLLVGETGERVEHAVEIGRDVKAEHLDVVPYVAYDADVVRFDYREDAAEEPRTPDAAREDGRLHAAAPTRSVVRTLRVRGPSRR